MALHESQSLLLEMQVCRSRAFASFAAPLLAETFGGAPASWESEAFYRRQIAVRPGPNGPRRCLISYLATNRPGAGPSEPMGLKKDVFEFTRQGIWTERVEPATGWPASS